MVALNNSILNGSGLYTVQEAAWYARMHPATLHRWLKGNGVGDRVFQSEGDIDRTINFLEFIQALAVRNLRIHYKVPLASIRNALNTAKEEFQIEYPFARRHTTFLFGKNLWIRPDDETGSMVQISGKERGQTGMTSVIEPFMKDVSFDSAGLANRYTAFQKNRCEIIMDPAVRFGEPLLQGCGYTPLALFEAAKAEGSVKNAASLYGVTEAQVETCIDYFDFLAA